MHNVAMCNHENCEIYVESKFTNKLLELIHSDLDDLKNKFTNKLLELIHSDLDGLKNNLTILIKDSISLIDYSRYTDKSLWKSKDIPQKMKLLKCLGNINMTLKIN